MMLEGFEALEHDDQTEVIVLISKPPAESVQEKILQKVKGATKPVVVCFIDGDAQAVETAGGTFASTLMEAARKAVGLLDPSINFEEKISRKVEQWIAGEKEKLSDSQKYIRGLLDRKSTRLNSSHVAISYAVFCLKKKKTKNTNSN